MIKTQNLTKSYDGLLAVDDLSFTVEPGEVLGFLGPNGAGKSTTMRMLAGFITPTSGTGSICGHDVATDALAAKAVLGYLPEGAPNYGEMTVGASSTSSPTCASRRRASQVAARLRHRPAAARAGHRRRPSRRCPRASSAASGSRRRSSMTPRC
jgi:ABC-type multidrug transport system ATPase subunit